MAEYQAGNPRAFESIYRLTAPTVGGYLSRWGGAATDDLVQDFYLQVIRARRTYRPEMPFRPWFFAIATHVATNWTRRKRRKRDRESEIDDTPQDRLTAPRAPDLLRLRLAEALGRLPEDQRDVVWLARVGGLTADEIAPIVGASPGAVRVRLHRAEAKLREWLA